jgi:hypothetical protein
MTCPFLRVCDVRIGKEFAREKLHIEQGLNCAAVGLCHTHFSKSILWEIPYPIDLREVAST